MDTVAATRDGSEGAALKEILESEVWFYYGDRNQGKPEHSVIALGSDQDASVNAADVFEAMGLDLGKLSQIFVREPWGFYRIPKEDRTIQPTVGNCEKLWKCRSQDKDGWIKLAVLAQKEIRLVSCDGESGERIVAVFYPSGKFEYFEKKEE